MKQPRQRGSICNPLQPYHSILLSLQLWREQNAIKVQRGRGNWQRRNAHNREKNNLWYGSPPTVQLSSLTSMEKAGARILRPQ